MTITDRVLMGPGPCNPYPEVLASMTRPVLGHLDPEFIALLDETNERLRLVFGTTNALTFPLSGTGSAGMEAAIVNFAGPGDTVVIGVNGVFGIRMCDVAERSGATVVRVDHEWGHPIDVDRMLDAHPNPTILAVVHAETSTGALSPLGDLGARKGDALFLADCVTSLGGTDTALDANGVDIAYSGTQKCIGVPPGLSPMSISPRALERMRPKPQSWYLDLNMIANYVTGTGGRAYHHTAPISMIYALHAGLGTILDEGLAETRERHVRCGQMLQDGLEKLGLELFAAPGSRLPQLTSVWVPESRLPPGMTEADVRQQLLERFGLEIGGGLGEYAGKVWRIGCMGHTARERNVILFLSALQEVLK
ncbi:MAG: alanine-glyoxylate transaminase/serine-glyoxylate transaminase/serine-pyruvate transaminase [Verrucomicrobiales bacterium]|jgi:alanine-glyoxylate transaminase/serine-glyoxylate transaminase/serine-pyruvate transaminase